MALAPVLGWGGKAETRLPLSPQPCFAPLPYSFCLESSSPSPSNHGNQLLLNPGFLGTTLGQVLCCFLLASFKNTLHLHITFLHPCPLGIVGLGILTILQSNVRLGIPNLLGAQSQSNEIRYVCLVDLDRTLSLSRVSIIPQGHLSHSYKNVLWSKHHQFPLLFR